MSGDPKMGASPHTVGVPIDELNEGVRHFFDAVKNDQVAKYSAEIAMVAFSSVVGKVLDFDFVERSEPPTLELELEYGGTSIGKAVKLALTLLEDRKKQYKEVGVEYYQPWLVIMTDGMPTDDEHIAVSNKVRTLINNKKLTVFPIGIGDGADMEMLGLFTVKRPPLKLKGLKFREFFEWLSQSACTVSRSNPGDRIELDTDGIYTWGEL
jgi:uncharacterized protein YegL